MTMSKTLLPFGVLAACAGLVVLAAGALSAQDSEVLAACLKELRATPASTGADPKIYGASVLTCAERVSAGARGWQYDYVQALGFYYLGSRVAADHMRDLALLELSKDPVAKDNAALKASLSAHIADARLAATQVMAQEDTAACTVMAQAAGIPVKPAATAWGGIAWKGLVPIDRASTLTLDQLQRSDALEEVTRKRFRGDGDAALNSLQRVQPELRPRMDQAAPGPKPPRD
jgi:hypothetical protein